MFDFLLLGKISIADKANSFREYFVMFWGSGEWREMKCKEIKIDLLIDVYDIFQ